MSLKQGKLERDKWGSFSIKTTAVLILIMHLPNDMQSFALTACSLQNKHTRASRNPACCQQHLLANNRAGAKLPAHIPCSGWNSEQKLRSGNSQPPHSHSYQGTDPSISNPNASQTRTLTLSGLCLCRLPPCSLLLALR